MATTTNSAGAANARALIAAGKINNGSWDFSAEDGNKLLGANGDDWSNYGKWFLATHDDADPKTKAHYGYPFGKGGEIYRNAVSSAKGRAAQQGVKSVEDLCSALLDAMDSKAEGKSFGGDNRGYSILEIKAVDESQRIITGVASTPDVDRMGDIVDPMGAQIKLPLPFLWQHDSGSPIGNVISAKPTPKGIEIVAQIAMGVSDQIDNAWKLIKAGLVRGLSIGFRGIDTEQIPNSWGTIFKSWEMLEVSAVTIPANAAATIQTVKSFDRRASAPQAVKLLPGVSGASPKPSEATNMGKTVQENISAFEATRQAKVARSNEIMSKASDEGRTLDKSESEEFDTIADEVKGIDAHLVRLNDQKRSLVATPVTGGDAAPVVDVARAAVVTAKPRVKPGTAFVRSVQAVLRSKGNIMLAAEIAKNTPEWNSTPEVAAMLKAAVAVGTITDTAFAGPLAPYRPMQDEFIELLRPTTLIGRIPGFRSIPFMVSMPRQTGGASAGWVGEAAPKPVSKQAYETITMPPTKIAVITVISQELADYSTPSAEDVISQDLIASIRQFQDQQFIDPTVTASANVHPASITNGAFNATISGVTIAAITADVNKLIDNFISNNIYPERGVFVMHPRTAQFLGTLRTTQDIFAFPGINMQGGTFFGWPVVTSASVPIDTGDDTYIILMDASEVFIAENGGITIDMSREASLQMNSAPDNPPTGSTVFTSLWQENLVGIRSEHKIGWRRRRDAAVAYLKGVSY